MTKESISRTREFMAKVLLSVTDQSTLFICC